MAGFITVLCMCPCVWTLYLTVIQTYLSFDCLYYYFFLTLSFIYFYCKFDVTDRQNLVYRIVKYYSLNNCKWRHCLSQVVIINQVFIFITIGTGFYYWWSNLSVLVWISCVKVEVLKLHVINVLSVIINILFMYAS